VALLVLFIVWVGYAIRWREGLLGLQYAIGLVIFLFAIEQMIWGLGLTYYIEYGISCCYYSLIL